MVARKRTRLQKLQSKNNNDDSQSSIENDSDYGPSGCESSSAEEDQIQTRSKSKRKRACIRPKIIEPELEIEEIDEDEEDERDIEIEEIDEDDDDEDIEIDDDEEESDIPDMLGKMAEEILGQILFASRRTRPSSDSNDMNDEGELADFQQGCLLPKFSRSSIPEPFKSQFIARAKRFDNCRDPDEKERTFLERVLRIPFGKYKGIVSGSTVEAKRQVVMNARKVFDESVYGMEHVKNQMVQIVAQALASNGICCPRIICLVGDAGSGKTKIASKGLATILKRPVVYIAMGSLTDASNLVGCSMFYHGSHSGGIVDGLMTTECMDPIYVFDEVDKIAENENGKAITNTLIHITDPLQNKNFRDSYFAPLPIDLSASAMVFLCNDEKAINPILRDRMHVIRVDKQSSRDKFEISKQFLWKEVIEQLKLQQTLGDKTLLSDEAIRLIVANGSSEKCEGGMRAVKRQMETIALYLNSEFLLGNSQLPCTISEDRARKILEKMRHHEEKQAVEGLSTSVQHMYL